MSSIPTIKIDQETAERVDAKWDDGNLATGGFVATESPDTYTVSTEDQQYPAFKKNFTEFMLDKNFKGNLTTGNNLLFKNFAEAIQKYSTSTATDSTPTPAQPKRRRIIIDFSDYQPEPIIATRPTTTEIEVEPPLISITTTTTTIPKSALNQYCQHFAKDDLSLVKYLELVYARAQKNHPETADQIQVEDLNIPGTGAQQHMQNIVAYFSTSPAEALLDEVERSAP